MKRYCLKFDSGQPIYVYERSEAGAQKRGKEIAKIKKCNLIKIDSDE